MPPSPSPSPPPTPSSSSLLLEVIEKIGGVALVPDLLPAIIFSSTRTVNSASTSQNNTLNTVVDSAPITTPYFIYVENPLQMVDPWRLNGGHLLTILLTHAFTCLVGVTGNVVVIANWWAAGTTSSCRRGRGGDGDGRRGQNFRMAAHHRLQQQQHRQLPKPTTAFLTSLAVADLLLLTVFMPLETAEYLVVTWDRQGHVCRLSAFVELLSAAASVLNLLAVSMERFLVIVYPIRARSWCTVGKSRRAVAIVWALAVLLAAPPAFNKRTFPMTYFNEERSVTAYHCFEANGQWAVFFALYELLLLLILPALLMTYCYLRVVKSTGIVSFSSLTYSARVGFYLLSFIHSAVNPFIYSMCFSNFR
ncbi:hypothetical protein TYRP_014869 [Tyrophagus putrescentiae]|nr:hypothetical protein TYRP_014869 [Tyrophagus putrescentiae]